MKTVSKVMTGCMSCVIFTFVMALSGCASKPQAAIDAADAAVKAAMTAEANVYFPAEMKAVQDTLSAINAKITAQESKTIKSYGTIATELKSVTDLANGLTLKAAAKKEEVKKGVSDLLASVNVTYKEVGDLVKGLPKNVKGIDLKSVEGELAGLKASLAEVQGLFDKGNYADAAAKAKEINQKASALKAQLTNAVAPKK